MPHAALCRQLGVPSSALYEWSSRLTQAPLPSSQREPLERSQLRSARSVTRPADLGRQCAYECLELPSAFPTSTRTVGVWDSERWVSGTPLLSTGLPA